MATPESLIDLLGLERLEREGGWFRRIREGSATPDGRAAWSSILALFTTDGFSALHRLRVDEVWCHQIGDPLEMALLLPDGRSGSVRLGRDAAAGECLQHTVPAGTWQGARPAGDEGWSVVSCVCVPGFRWDDFELGERGALLRDFPGAAGAIRRLTREENA